MPIPYIPYFQTSRYRVQAMIDLAEIKLKEKAADLGTGDGRIAIALALAGAIVDAYELNDDRIKEAKENIQTVILGNETTQESNKERSWTNQDDNSKNRIKVTLPTILKKDFWFEDLSQYSIICCYPMPTIMGRLEKKLLDELKPGSRVLLNYFPFKHWKLDKTKDNIFLYKKV